MLDGRVTRRRMLCCTPPDRNGLNAMFRGRYLEHEVRRFARRGPSFQAATTSTVAAPPGRKRFPGAAQRRVSPTARCSKNASRNASGFSM